MRHFSVKSGSTVHLVKAVSIEKGEDVYLFSLCGKDGPFVGSPGSRATCKKCDPSVKAKRKAT